MNVPQPSDGFRWTQAAPGRLLQCEPLRDVADHFFTTRDVTLRTDAAEWASVASAVGVAPDRVLLIRQVHGRAAVVATPDRSGGWTRPEADVIVSTDPASAIGVRVADCAPILLADRRLGAVGAAHAGWRGTVQRAAAAAVEAMSNAFGSRPEDLIAAIGPCLGPCCGEVGPEVVEAFRAAGHADRSIARWFASGPSGRPYLDLWTANRDQLEAAGVLSGNIHVARLCTRTEARVFHSYRADRERAGRMVGIIRMTRRGRT